MKVFSLCFITFFFSLCTYAQIDEELKEKWVVFLDYVEYKNYTKALPIFNWFIKNKPDLNENLYIKGIRMYHNMIEFEKDETPKKILQKEVLELYDMRIEYFDNEAKVLNEKAYYAYYYLSEDKNEEAFELYEKVIRLNGNATFPQNITSYFCLVVDIKDYDDEKIIEIYEELSKIVIYNIQNPQKDSTVEEWQEVQNELDDCFPRGPSFDCTFIKEKLLPKLEKASKAEKVEIMGSILGRMIKAKCTEEPEFLALAEEIYDLEPTFGHGNFLAKVYISKGDYTIAIELLNEIIPLAETISDEAYVVLTYAKIREKQAYYNAAKRDYIKVVEIDSSKKYEAYSAIARMYMNSNCIANIIDGDDLQNKSNNPVRQKAKYIEAYNMYKIAGNKEGMAKAKENFPTKTEKFNYSIKSGDKVELDCWKDNIITISDVIDELREDKK